MGNVPDEHLEDLAFTILEGVGDESLGTWFQMSPGIFHLRRRLSADEASLIGPVVDVRGTPEAARRLLAVEKFVRRGPPEMQEIAAAEAMGR